MSAFMNVLVTGANRGIGLELTRQLSARGSHVYAACRSATDELTALASQQGGGGVTVVAGVDVTDDRLDVPLAAALGDTRIDLLINNAGIIGRDGIDNLDTEACKRVFDVNSLGPLRVTSALLRAGNVAKGSKVVVITSRMGSIADNTSGSYYAYRMSKAAVNIGAVSLARDLEPKEIPVCLIHPGMVRTRMVGTDNPNAIPVEESAAGIVRRCDELDMSTSGTFWHQNGQVLPW